MANRDRLIGLGVPPELAKELESQLAGAGVQIGTTASTAMAGNRTPTTTIRGGVLQQTAQANTAASDVAGLVTYINQVMVKLRAAGVIAP